ncbi:MAG: hypothetical protein EXR62_12890 [Chloroflexi bacterium]|nr:hypothetical protein [Chloroflexota bacterium]
MADTSGAGWETHIPDGTFDAVLDLAGVPGMEDQLIRCARMRGRVVFVAGRSQVCYTFNTGQGREITIRQNSSFTQSDLTDTYHLLVKGALQIAPVIQDIIPAEAAGPIYDTLRDNPNKLYGTLFNWQT